MLLKDVDTQLLLSKTLPFQPDGWLAYMPKQQDKKLRDSSWSVDLWDG